METSLCSSATTRPSPSVTRVGPNRALNPTAAAGRLSQDPSSRSLRGRWAGSFGARVAVRRVVVAKKSKRDPEREDRITMEVVVDCYDRHEVAMGWYYYLEGRLAFPF